MLWLPFLLLSELQEDVLLTMFEAESKGDESCLGISMIRDGGRHSEGRVTWATLYFVLLIAICA